MIRIKQILQLNNKQTLRFFSNKPREDSKSNLLGGLVLFYSMITPFVCILINNKYDPVNRRAQHNLH